MEKWKFTEKLALVGVAMFVLLSIFVVIGKFWHGILEQLIIIVLIAVSLLPIWGLKRLMRIEDDPFPSQEWSVKKRIAFAVPLILYALVMLFAIGMSIDKIYTLILGNDVPAVVYSPLFIFPFVAAAELLLMFLFFFTRNGVIVFRAHSQPLKKRIAGFSAGVAMCVLIASVCFCSYSVVTPDGVRRVLFGRTTVYTWEDAEQVRLSSGFDDVLEIEVEFRDGTKQVILGASCSENDMLRQCYPDGVDQMIRDCVTELHRKGVPFVEQKNIEEKLDYGYWLEYLETLRTVYRAGE